jgi:hypothetical protein
MNARTRTQISVILTLNVRIPLDRTFVTVIPDILGKDPNREDVSMTMNVLKILISVD